MLLKRFQIRSNKTVFGQEVAHFLPKHHSPTFQVNWLISVFGFFSLLLPFLRQNIWEKFRMKCEIENERNEKENFTTWMKLIESNKVAFVQLIDPDFCRFFFFFFEVEHEVEAITLFKNDPLKINGVLLYHCQLFW